MSAHTDNDPHLWPILFWLLLVMLVGALFIYSHHADVQKQKLAAAEAALSDASARIAAVDNALDQSAQAAKSAEEQIAELRAEHQQDIRSLEAAHAEALDKLKAEHKDAVTAMQQQHGRTLSQLRDQLGQATQAADEHAQELVELRDNRATLERELEQNKASVSELNERLVKITEENHELTAKLGADNETIAGLNFELNTSHQVEAALRDKLERGANRQQRLQELVDKEEAAILDLQDKLVNLTRERETLAERADAAAKSAAGEPTQWQAELAKSQSLIAELQQELDAAVQEREAVEAQLDDASSAADPLVEELGKAKALIADLEDEIAALKETLRERDTALTEAQRAAEDATSDGDDTERARVTELTQTVATLEKKLAAAEDAHEKALADAKAAGTASVAQVRSLYSGAAALGGKLTENGILLSLAGDELQFASGTATLPDGDLPSLDRIAAFLKDQPGLTIRIEGHTDSSGSAEINQQLSKQRAEAVMQALIDRGVAADRISATGLGEENPIADNATEAGKRANRRVEIYAVREH